MIRFVFTLLIVGVLVFLGATVKLGKRTTAWRAADIAALIETLNANEGAK